MSSEAWLFIFAAVSTLTGLIQASPIVRDFVTRKTPGTRSRRKPFRARETFMAIALTVSLILSAIGAALELGWIPRSDKAYTDHSKYVRVSGRTFVNTKIPLDAHIYEHCTFSNVTFVYEGTAGYDLSYNTINGPIFMESRNRGISGAWDLAVALGFMKPTGLYDLEGNPKKNVQPPRIVDHESQPQPRLQ